MKTIKLLFICIIILNSVVAPFGAIAQNNRLWATYYGGTGTDDGRSVATDAAGNVYMTGITHSLIGIASGGFQNIHGGGLLFNNIPLNSDALLVKFDAAGNLLWATYYGGTETDCGWIVAIDTAGDVYLAVEEFSTGMASGGFQNSYGGGGDGLLVKFDGITGNRLWATYYGGTGWDEAYSVATDPAGNVYLTGLTESAGMASGGFQNTYGGNGDAFLVKFDGITGNRLWATYYGGAGNEFGVGLATDAAGNVYLTGQTGSATGIASGGFQNIYGGGSDAYLVKFDAAGNLLWATYYGGSGADYGRNVATDASGNVYLAGVTNSPAGIASGGFQNTYGGNADAFLVKFDGITGNRTWASYYGGSGNEWDVWSSASVATDASGNVYLAGTTESSNGIASGGFQNTFAGGTGFNPSDAFLVKFDAAGTRLCATYYGGPGDDKGYSITAGVAGNVYLAGWSSSTTGIASGGFQNTFGGGAYDAYLVKFTSCCSALNLSQSASICSNSTYTLPGGTVVSTGGSYIDTLTSVTGCDSIITTTLTVNQNPIAVALSNTTITAGNSTTLSASGGATYLWSNGAITSTITISPPITTVYCVTVKDGNGCTDSACVTIIVEVPCSELFVPNAFSPNGDGENDEFCLSRFTGIPSGQGGVDDCVKELSIIIYNRWGEKVYESTDAKFCWEGTYQARIMNTAMFVYYMEATLISGETIIKKGNISLIK